MAVLYANAFDTDLFVRRTLVYTMLTAILTMLYVGMIVGSQLVFATFSSQVAQSPLIPVASTLVIAALFQPLRRGILALIDRRFYRRKYDAAKTVAAFSATLRKASGPGPVARALAGRRAGDDAALPRLARSRVHLNTTENSGPLGEPLLLVPLSRNEEKAKPFHGSIDDAARCVPLASKQGGVLLANRKPLSALDALAPAPQAASTVRVIRKEDQISIQMSLKSGSS